MSLGISTVLQSSRRLLYWQLTAALILCATGVSVALDPFLIIANQSGQVLWAGISAASAACLIASALRRSNVHFLSITMDGRLFVAAGHRPDLATERSPSSGLRAASIRNATLLPSLILLQLKLSDGSCCTVYILPDSVPPETFRRLAVALRWIVRRNDPAQCGAGSAK